MNNKGFTLVELLATIVILGLVMGLVGVSVTNVIENSRTRSEKLFVERLSKSIDDYLDLYGSDLKLGEVTSTFEKCMDTACSKENTYDVEFYPVKNSDGTNITLNDLVDNNLVDGSKLVNPRNKKKCLEGKNPKIWVYKDSEFVYYYYVDLSSDNTSCEIEQNGIIDTLPENLKEELKKLKEQGVDLS